MCDETIAGKLIANFSRAYDSIGEVFPILRRAVGEVRYVAPVSDYYITSHGNKIRLVYGVTERRRLTTDTYCDSRCEYGLSNGSQ